MVVVTGCCVVDGAGWTVVVVWGVDGFATGGSTVFTGFVGSIGLRVVVVNWISPMSPFPRPEWQFSKVWKHFCLFWGHVPNLSVQT